MSAKTILKTTIRGEIMTNSNKENIRKWRDSMDRSLAFLHFPKIHGRRLSISLKFWISQTRLQKRKNDLDNLTKPILDSLKRMGVIEDDAYVYRLEISKFPTNHEEEVQIWIKQF